MRVDHGDHRQNEGMRLWGDFVHFGSVGGEGYEAAASNGGAELGVEYHENPVVAGVAFLDHAESAAFEVGKYRLDAEEGGDGVGDVFLPVAAADDEQIGVLGFSDFFYLAGDGVEVGDGDGGADDENRLIEFRIDRIGQTLLLDVLEKQRGA